ncbi:MAG: outer membrane lipoprotein chaperone LolA [Candidatus Methylumidiphilus sp.]
MIKSFYIAIFLFFASTNPASAEDSPVQRLHNFLAKASSLQADFRQVVITEKNETGKQSSGVFLLQRPGKFRWDYTKPYQQEIVSNGGKVWFYDVDLAQVTARKMDKAIGSTPALLLTGEVALEKNFTIQSQDKDEGLYWIKLIPKEEESGFNYVLIGLDGDNLAGMELSDNFGQLTRIYFSNLKLGVKLDSAKFDFKPPAGVDVFEDK